MKIISLDINDFEINDMEHALPLPQFWGRGVA